MREALTDVFLGRHRCGTLADRVSVLDWAMGVYMNGKY